MSIAQFVLESAEGTLRVLSGYQDTEPRRGRGAPAEGYPMPVLDPLSLPTHPLRRTSEPERRGEAVPDSVLAP